MIVEIISDSSKNGSAFPLIGEHYKARRYPYDKDKVTLIYQVDPNTKEKLNVQHFECSEENPLTNEYTCNVRILN